MNFAQVYEFFKNHPFIPEDKPVKALFPDLRAISTLEKDDSKLTNEILSKLETRFNAKQIYTSIGDEVLISVNPFKWLEIHNQAHGEKYSDSHVDNQTQDLDLEPHIFKTATQGFRKLIRDKKPTCFVISGESGSGKTTTTSFIIDQIERLNPKRKNNFRRNYGSFEDKNMTNTNTVEKLISKAVPLLDAFGNASTLANHNSSRFGKFIKLLYDDSTALKGAKIERYLLEKSRLIKRQPGERNFHVFNYLIENAKDYRYLKLEDSETSSNNDLMSYSKTLRHKFIRKQRADQEFYSDSETSKRKKQFEEAMDSIGIHQATQAHIKKFLKIILLIGNVEFKPKLPRKNNNSVLEIEDETPLIEVAKFMDIPPETIKTQLTIKSFFQENLREQPHPIQKSSSSSKLPENINMPYTINEAVQRRDALAKTLYSLLFDYVLNQCNIALGMNIKDSNRKNNLSLSILDIFGFENQQKNCFEQFCINFANEKLQHYCSTTIYGKTRQRYEQEGIDLDEFKIFETSKDCVDLFSKKRTGLFHILNQSTALTVGGQGITPDQLVSEFDNSNQTALFNVPQIKEHESVFTIKHFAGVVKYTATDFKEKNHDKPSPDVFTLFKNSKNRFLKQVTVSKSPLSLYYWTLLKNAIQITAFFKKTAKTKSTSEKVQVPSENLSVLDKKYTFTGWPQLEIQYPEYHEKIFRAKFVNRKLRYSASQHRDQILSTRNSGEKNFLSRKASTDSLSGLSLRKTISEEYMFSINSLISELQKCQPYFIRCIRPNETKESMVFDSDYVKRQLQYNGLIQTTKLSQSFYLKEERIEKVKRSCNFIKSKMTQHQAKNLTQDDLKNFLLQNTDLEKDQFHVGRETVFFKTQADFKIVEKFVENAWTAAALRIQNWWREKRQLVDLREKIRQISDSDDENFEYSDDDTASIISDEIDIVNTEM